MFFFILFKDSWILNYEVYVFFKEYDMGYDFVIFIYNR